jgi:hypothetical protein
MTQSVWAWPSLTVAAASSFSQANGVMALRPPVHLVFKGAWTAEKQEEWEAFQDKQQVEVMERVVSIILSKFWIVGIVSRLIVDKSMGYSWLSILFDYPGLELRCWTAVRMIMYFGGASSLRRFVRKRPQTTGIIVQMSWLLFTLTIVTYRSLFRETELLQHRYFITGLQFGMLFLVSVGYWPFWIHVCFGGPCIFAAWIAFHSLVGFWTVSMAIYGLIFITFLPAALSLLMEHLKWQQFQDGRELERAHHSLVATQMTLRKEKECSESMCQALAGEKDASQTLLAELKFEKQALEALLGMISDASCWLSSDGDTVTRSETRFDALVGRSMVGQSLCSRVPCSEHGRLRGAFYVEDAVLASPVRLLTTSIQQEGTLANVDLFIVDRRYSSPDPSNALGYLVGLRLSQPEASLDQRVTPWADEPNSQPSAEGSSGAEMKWQQCQRMNTGRRTDSVSSLSSDAAPLVVPLAWPELTLSVDVFSAQLDMRKCTIHYQACDDDDNDDDDAAPNDNREQLPSLHASIFHDYTEDFRRFLETCVNAMVANPDEDLPIFGPMALTLPFVVGDGSDTVILRADDVCIEVPVEEEIDSDQSLWVDVRLSKVSQLILPSRRRSTGPGPLQLIAEGR